MNFKPFKIGQSVEIIGKEGTNGSLQVGQVYEIESVTEENTLEMFKTFGYAICPIIVRDHEYNLVKPFFGKIRLKESL